MQQALDNITLHNTYFPEAPLHVTGFGRDGKGEFQIIVEQPYIKEGERKATLEEIKELMQERGFNHINRFDYANSQVITEDLHDENVIRTANGTFAVIDPTMYLNRANAKPNMKKRYNGTREVGNDIIAVL